MIESKNERKDFKSHTKQEREIKSYAKEFK